MDKKTLTREEILDICGKAAHEAQLRDDVCSRSNLIGLSQYFDIPDEFIRASLSLCGGAGASSGSCGTYTAGLLAVGLKYNVPLVDELANPELQGVGASKFMAFRDYFTEKMGHTMCTALQKQTFGKSYLFTKPEACAEYFSLEGRIEKVADLVEKATRTIAEFLLDND